MKELKELAADYDDQYAQFEDDSVRDAIKFAHSMSKCYQFWIRSDFTGMEMTIKFPMKVKLQGNHLTLFNLSKGFQFSYGVGKIKSAEKTTNAIKFYTKEKLTLTLWLQPDAMPW